MRQYSRLEKAVDSVAALTKTVEDNTESAVQREVRISVLENIVGNMHGLTLTVQSLSIVSTKLDTLLEATIKRMNMLEELLYPLNFQKNQKDAKCPHEK